MMGANQDEVKLYDDLKDFLASHRSDLRLAATDAVLQHILCGATSSTTNTTSSSNEGNVVDDIEHDTNTENGFNFRNMEKLVQLGFVPLLAKNCSYSDTNDENDADPVGKGGLVSINSLKALLHLSSNGTSANQVIYDLIHETGGMNRMIEIVLSSPPSSSSGLLYTADNNYNNISKTAPSNDIVWRQRVNYAMSLLVNMTRVEEGAVELAGLTMEEKAIPNNGCKNRDGSDDLVYSEKLPPRPCLDLMLARFLNTSFIVSTTEFEELLKKENGAILDSHYGDPYQHFSAVLMNLTQTEQGRQFVLRIHRRTKTDNTGEDNKSEEEWTVFQKLLSQLRSPNPIRRRGIAGMIRNCTLDRDFAWWFLNVVKITKHILYPLAGPEELDIDEKQGLDPDLWLEGPDKKREPDDMTRLYLVETVLLLCGSGRKSREQLRLERVYVILKWADMVEENETVTEMIYECVNYLRADEPGTFEGSSDQFVKDAFKKPLTSKMIGTTSDLIQEDFDDID